MKKEVDNWFRIPKYYGAAYVVAHPFSIICYPKPVNFIVRGWLFLRSAFEMPMFCDLSKWEKDIRQEWLRDLEDFQRSYFKMGHKLGFHDRQVILERQVQQMISEKIPR